MVGGSGPNVGVKPGCAGSTEVICDQVVSSRQTQYDAVLIIITAILVSQTSQPDGAKYLEEREGCANGVPKGTLTSSVVSVWEVYGGRWREYACAGPKDGGVSSTYWNLGEICGAYRTRHADLSLEKNVVPELWSVWLCL